jgi:hypothetical protein
MTFLPSKNLKSNGGIWKKFPAGEKVTDGELESPPGWRAFYIIMLISQLFSFFQLKGNGSMVAHFGRSPILDWAGI